jgi:hypothetical protein
MNVIWQALVDAKLVPQDSAGAVLPVPHAWGEDLLSEIVRIWTRHYDNSARSASQVGRTLQTLQSQQQRGAKLTWGISGCDQRLLDRWLGTRLAWWPHGIPLGRRVGLVSSRLGQDLDRRKSWFAVLRTVCIKLDPQREVLLTAHSTTTERFVERCGQLFGLRVLRINITDDRRTSLDRWAASTVLAGGTDDTSCDLVSLSPPVPSDREDAGVESLEGSPARDRAAVALSDRLVALDVRPHGHLDHLLRARLKEPVFPPTSVHIALGPGLVRKELAQELMDLGAVGWYVLNASGQSDDASSSPWLRVDVAHRRPSPVMSLEDFRDWPYLTHCTRRRRGPWPDEDENDFLDNLVLDRAGADHSALAALWRIVRSRRLIATSDMVRGETAVVSFTAVPLAEIHRLHTFRSHLGRWDFEPYGICIDRGCLEERGARPVVYGDENEWEGLAAEDRPFFQKKESKSATGRVMDWTAEREWRHVDDISLDEIPQDAAILFVPTETDARQLASISPWPVVVVRRS